MTEKACTQCKAIKPVAEFPACKTNRNGLHSWCFSCKRARSKAYQDRPDVKERMRSYRREWARQPKQRAQNKRNRIRRVFGLTPQQLNQMKVDQQGLCAICFQPEPLKRSLAIDHDHVTGKVRGLLCTRCNTALGMIQEDVEILINMTAYIDQHHPDGLKPIGI